MSLGLEWQDKNGQLLGRYDGPVLQGMLFEFAERDSACLRFIDAYGETTFNQLQIPVLLEELESLGADRELDDQLPVVRALLAFIEQARDQTHTYIKFIGD